MTNSKKKLAILRGREVGVFVDALSVSVPAEVGLVVVFLYAPKIFFEDRSAANRDVVIKCWRTSSL